MEITHDRNLLAVASYQHVRMYDLAVNNPNPILNYEGVSKNITAVGFQEDGKWMYTGGEDCKARIWDLRATNLPGQKYYQAPAPLTCVKLHPNQGELFLGDQSGTIHRWDMKTDNNERWVNIYYHVVYLFLIILPTSKP